MQKKILLIPLLLALGLLLSGCTAPSLSTLTVNVVSSSGKPISGVSVNVYSNYSLNSSDSMKWMSLNGSIQGSQQTGESGIVSFSLPTGNYAVNAWKDGYYYEGSEVVLDGSKEITIVLTKVKITKLEEVLNNESYAVTQAMLVGSKSITVELNPEIKSFTDSGEQDSQYFMWGQTKIVLCGIADGTIKFIDPNLNTIDANSSEPFAEQTCQNAPVVTRTNGQVIDSKRISVGTNQNGLYLYRVEYGVK